MIKYNHIGYLPESPEIFVIDTPREMTFKICHIDEDVLWEVVFEGPFIQEGNAYKGDFSAVIKPGDCRIVCGDERSNNFVIKEDPYGHQERLPATFYPWQRCGSNKGRAGKCHQELDNLYGTGKKLDMRKGCHQSGDLRCRHDGCSSAVYGYMRYAQETDRSWDEGLPDEEVRWGVDYFRKTVSPEGFIYDCLFTPPGRGPRDCYNSPAPITDHYNILRLPTGSSICFREKDPVYAEENLRLAEKIWDFVEKSDSFDPPYTPPVKNLPRGTQGAGFYRQNRKNCTGINCAASAAAYELFQATKKEVWREQAFQDMEKVIDCQIKEGEASGLFRDRPDNIYRAFQDCSCGHIHSSMVFLTDLTPAEPSSPHITEWKDAPERYCDMLVREYTLTGIDGQIPSPVGKNYKDHLLELPPLKDPPNPPCPLQLHLRNGSRTSCVYPCRHLYCLPERGVPDLCPGGSGFSCGTLSLRSQFYYRHRIQPPHPQCIRTVLPRHASDPRRDLPSLFRRI